MLPDTEGEEKEREVVSITPVAESLVITHCKSDVLYKCSEDGCSYSTTGPSLLGLHKAQAHNIKTAPKKGVVHQYFCPAPGCYYNPQTGRFFKTLDILRAHYMKVHNEKKFKCCQCQKAFGLERDCLRHEKECGQTFSCPDCSKVYTSRGALKMHCISKGHKKPLELCNKPKSSAVTVVVDKKTKPEKPLYPIPILPKLSPLDKISSLLPLTASTPIQPPHSTAVLPNQIPPPITVMLQSNNGSDISQPQDIPHFRPPPVSSIRPFGKVIYCDSMAQTVKSLPMKAKNKRNFPTQTHLSILERAMKSSKIPISKTSKATQKSLNAIGHKKRKSYNKRDCASATMPINIYNKASIKLTVATLTNPLQSNQYPHNIGSQTIFSTYESQPREDMGVDTSDIFYKMSMSTQTLIENPVHGLHQMQQDSNTYNMTYSLNTTPHIPIASQYNDEDLNINNKVSDSVTQTFDSFITTQMSTPRQTNSSETQTSVAESFNSTTQTQDTLALDSSTQTFRLGPDTSNLLDELFPDNEGIGINADTQTFGCFSSDMMTQTLEQLVSDDIDTHDIGTNPLTTVDTQDFGTNPLETINTIDTGTNPLPALDTHDIGTNPIPTTGCTLFVTNDMTTQTFEEMVDNIVDGTTQTHVTSDIMTQTFENIGVDIMTQTFDSTSNNIVNFDNLTQTENSICQRSESDAKIVREKPDEIFSKEVDSFTEIMNLFTTEDPTNQVNKSHCMDNDKQIYQSLSASILEQKTKDSIVLPDAQTQAMETLEMCYGEPSKMTDANSFMDSMTQTLSLPDEDLTLEALLSDMSTQTFEEDEWNFELDSLLQSSDNVPSDLFSQISSRTLQTNAACQTSVPLYSETSKESSSSNYTETGCPFISIDCENPWETGTQTSIDNNVREISLQTGSGDIWELSPIQKAQAISSGTDGNQAFVDDTFDAGTQTASEIGLSFGDDLLEIGTQTGEDNLWNMETQTVANNLWDIETQTAETNGIWEAGTQTVVDELWDMETQTGEVNDIWEVGTQTGGDNTGTQTVADNDIWEMGTQTVADQLWDTETQTGGDNVIWGIGTQTAIDNLWEMGTQTGGDNMATQTGADNLWDMETQTGDNNIWEMGTQTGGDNFLDIETQTVQEGINMGEIGTQTGGDNSGTQAVVEYNLWDMETQTIGHNNIWEIETQTGADNDIWEMGTQTMDNLLTDTTTQTGDDLIDFLLTGNVEG